MILPKITTTKDTGQMIRSKDMELNDSSELLNNLVTMIFAYQYQEKGK